MFSRGFIGATGGIRTPDHSVRSRVLYPAELRLHNTDYDNPFYFICQYILFACSRFYFFAVFISASLLTLLLIISILIKEKLLSIEN